MPQEDYNKGRAIGQKMRASIFPIVLLMLTIVFMGEYFIDNEFNTLILSLMLINITPALEGVGLKNNTMCNILGGITSWIGVIMLILTVLW
tara:strand:- start:628 stop:900 length:273 start_codon:yes stop_codon:yes gene_type:complete